MAELRVAGEKSDIGVLLKVLTFFAAGSDGGLPNSLGGAVGKKVDGDWLTINQGDLPVVTAAGVLGLGDININNVMLAIDTKFHLDFQLKIVGNFPR
jgi:hypothetical protein